MNRRAKTLVATMVMGIGLTITCRAGEEVLFFSGFDGTQGAAISSLPEWSDVVSPAAATKTIDTSQGLFTTDGTGWLYPSVRADKSSGVAFNFNPITAHTLRFEQTISHMTSASSTSSGANRIFLATNPNWNLAGWNMQGQKLAFDMSWVKGGINTAYFTFRIMNRIVASGNPAMTGTNVWESSILADLDGAEQLKIAMEVRDDSSGDDVRVGYQLFSGSWGAWTFSPWFDPTDPTFGDEAFPAGWKAAWASNTYYYSESYAPNGRVTSIWVDNATVTWFVPMGTLIVVQ